MKSKHRLPVLAAALGMYVSFYIFFSSFSFCLLLILLQVFAILTLGTNCARRVDHGGCKFCFGQIRRQRFGEGGLHEKRTPLCWYFLSPSPLSLPSLPPLSPSPLSLPSLPPLSPSPLSLPSPLPSLPLPSSPLLPLTILTCYQSGANHWGGSGGNHPCHPPCLDGGLGVHGRFWRLFVSVFFLFIFMYFITFYHLPFLTYERNVQWPGSVALLVAGLCLFGSVVGKTIYEERNYYSVL